MERHLPAGPVEIQTLKRSEFPPVGDDSIEGKKIAKPEGKMESPVEFCPERRPHDETPPAVLSDFRARADIAKNFEIVMDEIRGIEVDPDLLGHVIAGLRKCGRSTCRQ
jgi:hypothetical protein